MTLKISELSSSVGLDGTELLEMTQASGSVKVSVDDLFVYEASDIPQLQADYAALGVDMPEYLWDVQTALPFLETVSGTHDLRDNGANSADVVTVQDPTDLDTVREKVFRRTTINTSRSQVADNTFLDITTTERVAVGILFRPTEINGRNILVEKRSSDGWQLGLDEGGKLEIFGRPVSGGDFDLIGAESHAADVWHYAVFEINRVTDLFRAVSELGVATLDISGAGSFTNTAIFGPGTFNLPNTEIGAIAVWEGASVASLDDDFPRRFLAQTGLSRAWTGLYVNAGEAPFNAKGDGVTDDTAAIELAIAAAGLGGTVFIPPGQYLISTPINYTHRRILGSNYATVLGGTTIIASSGFAGTGMFRAASGPASMEGVHLDADGNATYCVHADQVSGATSIHKHLKVEGATTAGFWAEECQVTRFEQILAKDNTGVGLLIEASNSSLLVSCSAISNTSHGIHVVRGVAAGTITIIACQSEQNGGHGIICEGTANSGGNRIEQPRVRDCILEGNSMSAVYFQYVNSGHISGCRVISGSGSLYPYEILDSLNCMADSNYAVYGSHANNIIINDNNTSVTLRHHYSNNRRLSTTLNDPLEITNRPIAAADAAQINDSLQYYDTAAPTGSAWGVGDIAWDSAAAAGGFVGQVCTVAGTPGTWEAFGKVGADNYVLSDGSVSMTSTLTLFTGSLTTPSLTVGDAQTGLFKNAANRLAVTAGGTLAISWLGGRTIFPNGTENAPSATWGGSGTGVYRIGSDWVGFSTAGTKAFELDSNQSASFSTTVNVAGTFSHAGGEAGFYSATPVAQPTAYTLTATAVLDKTLLASTSATATNNNNVLAQLITDLQALGLIA